MKLLTAVLAVACAMAFDVHAKDESTSLAASIARETGPGPLAGALAKALKDSWGNCSDSTCFVTRKKDILADLANHEVQFNLREVVGETNLSVFRSKLAAQGKTLVIQRDHRTFKRVDASGEQKKVGFLVRIELVLEVLKGSVDVSSLLTIGASAKAGLVQGQLSVYVYGLSGEPILALLPSPSDISEASIQGAMESVALIKSKVYDSDVTVVPQDLLL